MLSRLSRPRTLALCALPVLALFGTAALAPLPFTLAQPGTTANVLGDDKGTPVITIKGEPTRTTDGRLLMTTIIATGPEADVGIGDVVDSWFRGDRAVMPRDSVYPTGDSEKEIEQHNLKDMRDSQNSAVEAALNYLDKKPGSVDVTLHLADVGGPSAGLFFSLGIIDKLVGDGSGGDLTGGRTVAGTGTIDADGTVGAVGGVSLKTQAARRDGATVFLVPKAECAQAKAEKPDGLRLIPVTTLKSAVSSLRALDQGGKVPSC
ncbi:S16 family serine protease [Streptomyces sp. NRRL WC-3549]|uniref:S16 family serine protease n=1 Tax=Streptomyces sp. NRRL WC-3549 TaxID=1463925 RepID=UPI0004C81482|nr:S16 family serine protease [Streptomyces sp. NRRL WC-3549]